MTRLRGLRSRRWLRRGAFGRTRRPPLLADARIAAGGSVALKGLYRAILQGTLVAILLLLLSLSVAVYGQVRFVDVALEQGIDFIHENGSSPEKRLPETNGSGSAFFDMDGDGDLDLYLVNSGHMEQGRGEAWNQLYRNDGPIGRAGRLAADLQSSRRRFSHVFRRRDASSLARQHHSPPNRRTAARLFRPRRDPAVVEPAPRATYNSMKSAGP